MIRGNRGVSPALGIALMVAIVVMLAAVGMVTFSQTAKQELAGNGKPGLGAYDVKVDQPDEHRMQIDPQAVDPNQATFVIQINGHDVYEWSGDRKIDIKCLYPGDKLNVYAEVGGRTNLLFERKVTSALDCKLDLLEQFEWAYVDGQKVRVGSGDRFRFSIDPDGPGPDGHQSGFLPQVGTNGVGPIPVSNDWHYVKKYPNTKLEGINPPVWVIVMTDNVHWDSAPASNPSLNWTDPPAGTPGKDSYHISGHQVVPDPAGSEPTNDIYVVFKPGCGESKIKLVEERAGYDNQLLVNGKVAIANTNTAPTGTVLDAPGIHCGY